MPINYHSEGVIPIKRICLFFGLFLCVPLIFAGCGSPKARVALFPKEVKTVEVSYLHAAEATTWELEQADITAVREWAAALELEPRTFEEGNSPGDSEGGTVYDFRINGGDASFSYLNAAGSYIILEDEWYAVGNPSDPPIEKPAKAEPGRDKIPMVMVNGRLYYDTGKESALDVRCGTPDGAITSAVDPSETPTKDDQSNFGTGFPYQYTGEHTIELLINEKWMVFEHREGTGSQVRFGDRMVDADSLSGETLKWLDWYNSLPAKEQLAISAIPSDLLKASGLFSTEDAPAAK